MPGVKGCRENYAKIESLVSLYSTMQNLELLGSYMDILPLIIDKVNNGLPSELMSNSKVFIKEFRDASTIISSTNIAIQA